MAFGGSLTEVFSQVSGMSACGIDQQERSAGSWIVAIPDKNLGCSVENMQCPRVRTNLTRLAQQKIMPSLIMIFMQIWVATMGQWGRLAPAWRASTRS